MKMTFLVVMLSDSVQLQVMGTYSTRAKAMAARRYYTNTTPTRKFALVVVDHRA